MKNQVNSLSEAISHLRVCCIESDLNDLELVPQVTDALSSFRLSGGVVGLSDTTIVVLENNNLHFRPSSGRFDYYWIEETGISYVKFNPSDTDPSSKQDMLDSAIELYHKSWDVAGNSELSEVVSIFRQ